MSKRIKLSRRQKDYELKKALDNRSSILKAGSVITPMLDVFIYNSKLFYVVDGEEANGTFRIIDIVTSGVPIRIRNRGNSLLVSKETITTNFRFAKYEDFNHTKTMTKNFISDTEELTVMLKKPVYKFLKKENIIVDENVVLNGKR